MSYHKLLGFEKEPFSTSPDPEFLHLTREHEIALTNILIELRLRRGLMVIFGDIGTGKTTLSRRLVQELRKRQDMVFHMILNPSLSSEEQLLLSLIRNFNIPMGNRFNPVTSDVMDLRDAVEKFLIEKTIQDKKTIVLIIDEAQKLNEEILESLRLLLNFETNEFKLIQVVLLGQLELYPRVSAMANFMDRISFKYTLHPLNFENTKAMIEFRLKKAGRKDASKIFFDDAIREIFEHTEGYPRKINMLCHQILKELVIENKAVVDRDFVRQTLSRLDGAEPVDIEHAWNRPSVMSGQSMIS